MIIGLPDGANMRAPVSDLLNNAGIAVPHYTTNSSRKYLSDCVLPSGRECPVLIDKPRDLVFALAEGRADIILTGSDYVDDFMLFLKVSQNIPLKWSGASLISAHRDLPHLGFHGLQLACLVPDSNHASSISEILEEGEAIFYTEFPLLVSKALMRLTAYHTKFGNRRPNIVSTFSASGGSDVTIIYSSGATESKAHHNKHAVVIDIVRTGRTLEENGLRVVEYLGSPIYNGLYRNVSSPDILTQQAMQEVIGLIEQATEKR